MTLPANLLIEDCSLLSLFLVWRLVRQQVLGGPGFPLPLLSLKREREACIRIPMGAAANGPPEVCLAAACTGVGGPPLIVRVTAWCAYYLLRQCDAGGGSTALV